MSDVIPRAVQLCSPSFVFMGGVRGGDVWAEEVRYTLRLNEDALWTIIEQ